VSLLGQQVTALIYPNNYCKWFLPILFVIKLENNTVKKENLQLVDDLVKIKFQNSQRTFSIGEREG